MTKTSHLLTISCLFLLSSFALSQFLPPIADPNEDQEMIDQPNFNDEDFITDAVESEEYDIEHYEEGNEENQWNYHQENTAEEIGEAMSANIAQVIIAYSGVSDIIGKGLALTLAPGLERALDLNDTAANNLAEKIGQVIADTVKAAELSAVTVGNAIGGMVTEAVRSFRDAKKSGEDAGAAVGVVIGNAIRDLNDNSERIGNAIEDTIREAIHKVNLGSDEVNKGVDYIGEGVQRFIAGVTVYADVIGKAVGWAVDDAVERGDNAIETVSYFVANVVQVVKDNVSDIGEVLGDIARETFSGLEGISEPKLKEIRRDVRRDVRWIIRNGDPSLDKVDILLNNAINSATGEDGEADFVDVMNEVGRRFVEDIESTTLIEGDASE